MKEIKFRYVFRKPNGYIIKYFTDIQHLEHGDICLFLESNLLALERDLISRDLDTGLQDKTGKEAYHKDIIQRGDKLYILEWHDNLASWFLKPLHGGWHGITKSDMSLMCEILGNIHENLDLLTKEE